MKLSKIIKKIGNGYIAKCNYIKYYRNCKINPKVILLESQQGKEYNGNIYYIAKELSNNEEYKDYTIYMSIIKEISSLPLMQKELAIFIFSSLNS